MLYGCDTGTPLENLLQDMLLHLTFEPCSLLGVWCACLWKISIDVQSMLALW